jgi:zona occludens toxin
MSVILITGPTGGGKTALVVDMLAHTDEFKNRPLFVMGIPHLAIDHEVVPPIVDWVEHRVSPEDPSLSMPYFTFPPHSVIVLDEAQRVYRPRASTSKVPDIEAAFETHRHTGVDFILITQTPNQISAHVRRLVVRHIHVHQSSLKRELLEWATPGGGEPESRVSRELATRRNYSPPKRVFDLYKSAEAHTKLKRRIPRTLFVTLAALVIAVVLIGYSVNRMANKAKGNASTQSNSSENKANPASPSNNLAASTVKTTGAYLADFEPRVPGLQHTAPAYDAVTQVKQAPIPMCYSTTKKCRCIDQQGNDYAMADHLCRQVVQHGIFLPFRDQPSVDQSQQAKQPQSVSINSINSRI